MNVANVMLGKVFDGATALVSGCKSEGARKHYTNIPQVVISNMIPSTSTANTLANTSASNSTNLSDVRSAPGESKVETKVPVVRHTGEIVPFRAPRTRAPEGRKDPNIMRCVAGKCFDGESKGEKLDRQAKNTLREYRVEKPEILKVKMEKIRILASDAQKMEQTAKEQLPVVLDDVIKKVGLWVSPKKWQLNIDLGKIKTTLDNKLIAIEYDQVQDAIENAFKGLKKANGNLTEDIEKSIKSLENIADLASKNLLFTECSEIQLQLDNYSSFGKEKTYDDEDELVVHMEALNTAQPCGVAHSQGRRKTMEDDHLATAIEFRVGPTKRPVFAELRAVFDGHTSIGNGQECAKWAHKHLAKHLITNLESACVNLELFTDDEIEAAICQAIKFALPDLSEDFKLSRPKGSGATAILGLYVPVLKDLFVGNVGDSRAIVIDSSENIIQASLDQKPDDLRMKKEIEKRGGCVESNRVMGVLSTARALGDHGIGEAKGCSGVVSARPDVALFKNMENFDLVLVCDGALEDATTNALGNIVIAGQKKPDATPAKVAATIVGSALTAGSRDNVTVMINQFGKRGNPASLPAANNLSR